MVNYLTARTGRDVPMRFSDKQRPVEITARHVVRVNESNAHLAAGLAGLGVIQTFSFIARPAVDRGELVPLLARFQPPPYEFHLAYPPNRYVSNRLRVFIDWAAELFGRLASLKLPICVQVLSMICTRLLAKSAVRRCLFVVSIARPL